MADLILSPIVDILLENLATYLKDQYELRTDIKGKLEKLKISLNQIQAVAKAADEVEIEKNEHLAAWLKDLKDAAYEAEDVLDKIEYQRLERQAAAADEDDDGGERKRAKISDFFSPSKFFKRFTQSSDPLEKLGSVQDKFEQLAATSGNFLQLVRRERSDWEQRKKGYDKRRETTSFTLEPEFVGRTQELEEIVHLLLVVDDGSASKQVPPVVPIVGPGGFGKTTLARHAFHDQRVVEHFQARLWVHVSQNFDVKRLTREMIESASGRRCDVENLDRLQQDLKDAVGTKRFLLVLDDLWWGDASSKTEQLLLAEEDWGRLFAPLVAGARGSMVLLTSRTKEAASLPRALPPILLGGLVHDECWKIIKARAFSGDRDPAGYPNLAEIGKQIASKVKGSPLAANAVGGMLRNNRDDGYWSRILDTGLGDQLPGVMDVLNLSYQQLPPHLRKCFAYCSLFPKGHSFLNPNELGCLWVAQGFIRPRPEETMEEAGRKCFNDLLSSSFFQIVRFKNYPEYYVMHDLMNELARNVSRGDYLGYGGGNIWEDNIPEMVRHISVMPKHLSELSNRGCKFGNLRSFLILGDFRQRVDEPLIKEVLKQLRCVRVLSLDDHEEKELPDDVGDWIHLRYLSCRIKRLPESLCRLYHLQVLTVMGCSESRDLPRKMNNLTNLRILNTPNYALSQIAFIERLTSLEALKGDFGVRRERGYGIGQLKDLNGLRGKLTIWNIENVESRQEAKAANLCGKRWLEELTLGWNSRTAAARSPDVDEEVLQALQPHSDLKKLSIKYYTGSTCPSWMFNQRLPKLKTIELKGLIRLVRLPPLEQLSYLKYLELINLPAVRQLCGHEFYGGDVRGFPSLERLTIVDMAKLEEWSGLDDGPWFPRLQKLEITDCPKLRSLPPLGHLPSLKDLRMKHLHSVKEIGHEVNQSGGDGARCFPSLEMLYIDGMPELEDRWSRRDGSQWFPRLRTFIITNCPKLRMLPPISPTLAKMNIQNVGLLALPRLDDYCDDAGMHREGAATAAVLSKLCIVGCPNLSSLGEGLLHNQHRLRHLKELVIKDCEQLVSPLAGGFQELISLEILRIENCPKLTLPIQKQEVNVGPLPFSLKYVSACYDFGDAALQGLTNLSSLRIVRWSCLPPAELLRHLTTLQELIIVDCEALAHSGLAGVAALVSLKKLAIKGCPRLLTEISSPTPEPEDVAGTAFSSSLEHLVIDHLLLLTTVPILKTVSSLKHLSITVAFQGTSFPTEVEELLLHNRTTLKRIEFLGTPSFKSLPDSLQCLSSLMELKLYDAPELRSLPDLPNSLKILLIGHPHIELKTRYQKDFGPDWHKIQHIKQIDIGRLSDNVLQIEASYLVDSVYQLIIPISW